MAITLKGCISVNNAGDGLRIIGNPDVIASDMLISNNGGHGINVLPHAGIMDQLGLPQDTNPKELAHLLLAIRGAQSNEKSDVIKKSDLFSKIVAGGLTTIGLVETLINIANSPQADIVMDKLSK